ncbi:MAG: SurA N-terminal domain-containing protein [Desulfohalobiaceae bacterium]|nr:SurA N-terminal domain-containing protein [Desulfohalobiaceae bacterium]
MLDGMRRNAQSWGIKLLFGIIVLVFVFWGVGGFQGDEKAILATVDGERIETRDFQKRYQRRLESLRQQREDLDTQDLREMDFKRRVFEQMVDKKLLLDAAEELGLVLPRSRIRERIQGMEVFQGKNKAFNATRYVSLLRANRMSPAQFEAGLRRDVLVQKMTDLLAGPVEPTPSQAKDFFEYVNLQGKVSYLTFAAQDYLDQVEVSQEEIEEYYRENKEAFQKPARMKMDYLRLTPSSLARYQEVEEGELRRYYERNRQDFQGEAEVKVRHILFSLEQDAEEKAVDEAQSRMLRLRDRIEAGEVNFAQAARQHSQGPSASEGGSLGWITKGDILPALREKTYSLEPGQISEPVRTRKGWHLIKVEDRREGGVKPFAEVKGTVRKRVARDKAAGTLDKILDKVLEKVFKGKDLAKAAKEAGLEVKTTGWFTREEGPKTLELQDKHLKQLFDLKPQQVTDIPIILDNGYLLAQKTGGDKARTPELSEVRDAIVQRLRGEKAAEKARTDAEKTLEKLRNNGQVPESLRDEMQQSGQFSRRGRIPGLGASRELARDVFVAETGEWLPRVYQFESRYVVARADAVTPPSDEAWRQQKPFWIQRLSATRKQNMMDNLVQVLREDAEIDIKTPEILRY